MYLLNFIYMYNIYNLQIVNRMTNDQRVLAVYYNQHLIRM